MEWIRDIKGLQYEQLLKELFSLCDMVQCVMREDDPNYFEAIEQACISKNVVTKWRIV